MLSSWFDETFSNQKVSFTFWQPSRWFDTSAKCISGSRVLPIRVEVPCVNRSIFCYSNILWTIKIVGCPCLFVAQMSWLISDIKFCGYRKLPDEHSQFILRKNDQILLFVFSLLWISWNLTAITVPTLVESGRVLVYHDTKSIICHTIRNTYSINQRNSNAHSSLLLFVSVTSNDSPGVMT